MEEYEKKYKEVLGRARTFSQRWDGIKVTDSELALKELKEIFPELKENEDEDKKARESLLKYLKESFNFDGEIIYPEVANWIAWLEKQDPKKHEEELERAYKCADEVQYRRGYEDAKRKFKKNKVELKFNASNCISIVDRDGEQWVRVCALGEDFIIAAHNYREGDKTGFTWEEACEIGTFNKKQGYIMLALKDKINARLEEIGGEPLASSYWSSSEYSQNRAWSVYFYSGSVSYLSKSYSLVARAVAAF